jgi:hypothetical protein
MSSGVLAAIEEPLNVAMLMLIAHWYERRETVALGEILAEIRLSRRALRMIPQSHLVWSGRAASRHCRHRCAPAARAIASPAR